MGNLPKDRVQSHRAFFVSGVDYCGPLYYRSEIRTRAPIKCYISLFICFTTKAVHLELVKDLSTQSFLAALKRFISTRGKPKTIWSDNATNLKIVEDEHGCYYTFSNVGGNTDGINAYFSFNVSSLPKDLFFDDAVSHSLMRILKL